MGLAFGFRFWVQVQCIRPCDRDQHALSQVFHPSSLSLEQLYQLGLPNGKITPAVLLPLMIK